MASILRRASKLLSPKKSSDPPTDSGAPSDDHYLKYHSIKAFRTIITMLDIIPSQHVMTVVDRIPASGAEDKELKLLNALATLLVRRHEVAAVAVTKHDDGSGVIEVIACHHVSSDKLTIPRSATSSTTFWNFLAALNPRPDTPSGMSVLPAIINPKDSIPPHLQETQDLDQIITYYYDTWRKETHMTHAWMLGRLSGHFNIFQEYVIAACFEKMLTKMENKLSIPYLDAIASLPEFQFKETDLQPGPKRKEAKMEKEFGDILGLLTKHHLITIPVTNLLAAIGEGSNELYTKDTCQEFHQLLCELISRFHDSLKELKSLDYPARDVFDDAVRKVAYYGEALQMMASGIAIQRHFKVIETQLSLLHHKRARDVANKILTLLNGETKGEHDVDLQNVQPFAIRDGMPLPMWKAAKEWLKLMVVHFDATKIVTGYYRGTGMVKLSIKLIVPPQSDDKMLPWKDLIRDANYIGPGTENSNPINSPTSEYIITFLEKHAKNTSPTKGSNRTLDMLATVDRLVKSSSTEAVSFDDLKTMEVQLSGLRVDMSPDQAELTTCIRDKIGKLKNKDDGSKCESLYSIVEMLESLERSSLFYKKLREGTSLSKGHNFDAVPHCELILGATLAMAKTSPSTLPEDVRQELSNAGHILGISRPSCPVCLEVLGTVGLSDEPFIFRGSHSSISACTLPAWLPMKVIDGVAKKFGALLREDLIKLVRQRDILMRGRTKSSQSATLSLESNDESTEEPYGHRNLETRDEYYAHNS